MGKFNIDLQGRPEPITIAVKRTGDPVERFLNRSGTIVTFQDVKSGSQAYEVEVTDGNGQVSRSNFSLDCTPQNPCNEGPEFRGELLEFDGNHIKYQFHGNGVDQILREILFENTVVDTVIDLPSGPIVNSPFQSPLAGGAYTARIRGYSCYSETPSSRGFTIVDDSTPLAWVVNYPTFDKDGATYRLLAAITKTGTYTTKITNTGTSAVLLNTTRSYTAGSIAVLLSGLAAGTYLVEIGILSGTVPIVAAPAECDEGPDALEILEATKDYVKYKFHGKDVFVLEQLLTTVGDVIVKRATIEPSNSIVTFTFDAPVSPGNYILKLRGSSCSSPSPGYSALPVTIAGAGTLAITSATPTLLADGRYKIDIVFTGGRPLFSTQVKNSAGTIIYAVNGATGSPVSVVMPAGVPPQTVKLALIDADYQVDEEAGIVLPPVTGSARMLYADEITPYFNSAPMEPGVVNSFALGTAAGFNWDVELSAPNGGLWDAVIKYAKVKVGGVYQDINVAGVTGEAASYNVVPTTTSLRMFQPRKTVALTINGSNPFKVAGQYIVGAILKKGGLNGSTFMTVEREFTYSAPPALSGIQLMNHNGTVVGSKVDDIAQGVEYIKPKPYFDIFAPGFNGQAFNSISFVHYYKNAAGNYEQLFASLFNLGAPVTSIAAGTVSMFKAADLATVGKRELLFSSERQDVRTQISFKNGSATVGTFSADYVFTPGTSAFVNAGFVRTSVGGKDYQLGQGMDFGVRQKVNGNLQLYHPVTRRSINGQNDCYPYVYLNFVRMDLTDLATFRSDTGLSFPKGTYDFHIMWFSGVVTNYDGVVTGGATGNAYNIAGENIAQISNTGYMPDSFTVTVL